MARIFDTPLFTSDQSIDRVLNAGLPVLLVFIDGQAPASLESVIKSLAKQHAGQLLVAQVMVKDNPETARRYGVRQTPVVVALKDGQVQTRAESATGEDLQQHAAFLTGSGPRPQPRQQQTAGATVSGQAQGQASAANGGTQASGTQAGGGHPVAVTDATFEQEVMRSPVPVVVDFWAPWCGPCRMVAPVLDKLAREWNGKVKIAKVNVDENPLVAGRYGITGIPTMMVFSSGKLLDRWAGALPEPNMRSRLSSVIK